MSRSRQFLSETHDREAALADFESLDIRIVQDPFAQYDHRAWRRESHFTKANLPRYLACLNPRCRQGGLDLQQIVEFSSPGQHSYRCNGHEGTPKGKRISDACGNSFDVTLSVVRRPHRKS